MKTEILYVSYFVIGFIAIAISLYFFTRKKVSDRKTELDIINNSLYKRFHYNTILLYIFGVYRLVEFLYFIVKGDESEQEFYTHFVLQGILSIPLMIIGFLAVISAIIGIFLSLASLKKERDNANKLLIVSTALLVVTFFWKYILGILIPLVLK